MLRPSRFRPIRIGLPLLEARREIIKKHAQRFNIKLTDELIAADRRGDQRTLR